MLNTCGIFVADYFQQIKTVELFFQSGKNKEGIKGLREIVKCVLIVLYLLFIPATNYRSSRGSQKILQDLPK